MPPKKLNRDGDQKAEEDKKTNKPTVSDEEVRQESGKAANAALAAQKKAKELKDAAAAAGDPEEREKLTAEATNAEIEAESFGKTAKYLRSGAFQGMAMGTGLGVAPGATLGAISGTLVGASEEQKRTLEKMVGQAKDEETPGTEELEKFKSEGGGGQLDEGWLQNAKGMLPKQEDVSDAAKAGAQATGSESVLESKDGTSDQQPHQGLAHADGPGVRKKPRKLNSRPTGGSDRVPDADGNDNTKNKPTQGKQGSDTHNEGEMDERTKRLNQREADLDRREAELKQREKTLEKREKELESRSTGHGPQRSTTPEPKGHPRKLGTKS
ncbi:hypothetical protein COCC4DRAFT_189994 [Bipolaris maydis ATCC 48331]|uniref:Uncharacterized protein n=3 Tax=Cochliobolus heterostrophus TaxID=5016 RepID=M2T4W9_COCH5|nr:uncharacterized protein COCC4DRAFT_189994 [Bipolaris maydis ATCC 48331]EMD92620.1 hypothetical protein COCHEDRAFT_1135395 [Bipolaris maydis C5]KAJ5022426.1 hypothetical protein J3E73DRAFT_219440 [Bipolaris maydis]ENI08316.1 hypothetical protein COCC4DRAFT_189994 [Bipolaris maydis ATCC 48331]KAJ6210391.1 hypothetical protein PSV09DRAFT_1135395 [Bipolaris maydis]KAJ6281834.1 hypothetical protein J3E71DRAFT_217850 [Bipolaris maydis]